MATAVSAVCPPERIVLVVDDEDSVRRIMARILSGAGFHVLEARDGAEALGLFAKLGTNVVWLVVSDIAMPRMAGDELAEIIAREWPTVHVLLVSGQGTPRPGFAGSFMRKPFTPEALVATVKALLPSAKVVPVS